jgi:hypothetical protein
VAWCEHWRVLVQATLTAHRVASVSPTMRQEVA